LSVGARATNAGDRRSGTRLRHRLTAMRGAIPETLPPVDGGAVAHKCLIGGCGARLQASPGDLALVAAVDTG
jgi:hypothetical protein